MGNSFVLFYTFVCCRRSRTKIIIIINACKEANPYQSGYFYTVWKELEWRGQARNFQNIMYPISLHIKGTIDYEIYPQTRKKLTCRLKLATWLCKTECVCVGGGRITGRFDFGCLRQVCCLSVLASTSHTLGRLPLFLPYFLIPRILIFINVSALPLSKLSKKL